MENLLIGLLIGLVVGFGGWHLYYTRALSGVVKKVGYGKRSKNKRERAPRKQRTAGEVKPLSAVKNGNEGDTLPKAS